MKWVYKMEKRLTFGEIKEQELATSVKTKEKSITVLMIILVLIIGIGGLMIKKFVDVRLGEVNSNLSLVSRAFEGNRSLHILVKYFMILQKSDRNEENTQDYMQEAALQLNINTEIANQQNNQTEEELTIWGMLDKGLEIVAQSLINVVRFVMMKEKEDTLSTLYDDERLQEAYIKERRRKFEQALSIYEDLLKSDEMRDLTSYLLVHIGFCQAQLSKYDEAIASLQQVVDKYPGTEDAKVSEKLLNILTGLKEQYEMLEDSDLDELEKAKRYYFLGNYSTTITLLEEYLRNNADTEEARFYLARAKEEIGSTQEALDIYTELARGTSEYSVNALNRIALTGTIYRDEESPDVKTLLEEINPQIDEENQNFVNELMNLSETMNQAENLETDLMEETSLNFISAVDTGETVSLQEQMSNFVTTVEEPDNVSAAIEQGFEESISQPAQETIMEVEMEMEEDFNEVEESYVPPDTIETPVTPQVEPEIQTIETQTRNLEEEGFNPLENTSTQEQQDSFYRDDQMDLVSDFAQPLARSTSPRELIANYPELEENIRNQQQLDIPIPDVEVTLEGGEVIRGRVERSYGNNWIIIERSDQPGVKIMVDRNQSPIRMLNQEEQTEIRERNITEQTLQTSEEEAEALESLTDNRTEQTIPMEIDSLDEDQDNLEQPTIDSE